MNASDLFFHLLNFLAPAVFVAMVMVLVDRLIMGKRLSAARWWIQGAVNFAVCASVLVLGLWFFGRDGKMLTYATLVVCAATSQWLMRRGWRGH